MDNIYLKKEKAIALCRVSTTGQLLEGNLEPQEKRIRLAANIINVELVKIWKVAISSRKGKNVKRKDLTEMLEYCKRYKSTKYVIVDEVDRFMRSISEYYWWKMEFQNVGVQLRFANRPEVDPESDRAVFDELIDVYRAEQSNNERIHKTPEKMAAKMRAGYYPSNPHTGYKISSIPGLHIPDEPNWSAMQKTFSEIACGECTISEGLKRVTERGLRTKNYGPKAVGGRKIDMHRWKDLLKDPYYCGVIKFKDWNEENENGLHTPIVTKEQHRILSEMVNSKGKRFIVNRKNPLFLMSNEIECNKCLLGKKRNPRLVGYTQRNGIEKGNKEYQRYRCRQCNLPILQKDLHGQIDEELKHLILTEHQKNKLIDHMQRIWRSHEKGLLERVRIALGYVETLKAKKSNLISLLANNPELADDIKEELNTVKKEIKQKESEYSEATGYGSDLTKFIKFAFDYLENAKQNWWSLDKETMKRCKQIFYPSGIQLLENKKVYIPEISPIYRYETNKKVPEGTDYTCMEGPVRLELTTSCLKGRRSNQLSYGPVSCLNNSKKCTIKRGVLSMYSPFFGRMGRLCKK